MKTKKLKIQKAAKILLQEFWKLFYKQAGNWGIIYIKAEWEIISETTLTWRRRWRRRYENVQKHKFRTCERYMEMYILILSFSIKIGTGKK